MSTTVRSKFIDFLKGLAIIAVVLYHLGVLPFGYLGVEIFFVIAGYLTTKTIVKAIDNAGFSYWNFITNRLSRLWPLLILVILVSLGVGYFVMLPDGLKNTSETAAGTSLFLNNFVQYVTSSDYWDTTNDYKPLMHTWYVGVLFQFYLIFPFVFLFAKKVSNNWKRVAAAILVMIGVISLAVYISSLFTVAFNFYLLPSRLFEFNAGSLIALYPMINKEGVSRTRKEVVGVVLVLLLLILGCQLDANKSSVILTVVLTCWLLSMQSKLEGSGYSWNFLSISKIGVTSYSIYLWHQLLFAFYKYVVNYDLSYKEYIALFVAAIVLGYVSYILLEKSLDKLMKKNKARLYVVLGLSAVFSIGIVFFSLEIYKHHGVVRDVPELNIYVNEPKSWEPQDYNNAIYQCNIDFPKNGKKNILVVGDSYGRDWYNVLKEAHVDTLMNLSYRDTGDSILGQRIKKADIVFLATHGDISRFKDYLPLMMQRKFFRVGDKRFFATPGVIYNKPHDGAAYYQYEIVVPKEVTMFNANEARLYGEDFINPMDVMKKKDGKYKIFTDDHKLISHDGLHLTQAGAKYYAKHIDLRKFLF